MGTGSVFVVGASQMHKGIPHLHSISPKVDCCSVVGSSFGCFSASMSNLETLSVTESAPSTETWDSNFFDLYKNKVHDNCKNKQDFHKDEKIGQANDKSFSGPEIHEDHRYLQTTDNPKMREQGVKASLEAKIGIMIKARLGWGTQYA